MCNNNNKIIIYKKKLLTNNYDYTVITKRKRYPEVPVDGLELGGIDLVHVGEVIEEVRLHLVGRQRLASERGEVAAQPALRKINK